MQAVVRGRKLRQQLSLARQAATYTDDSSQPEAHDSDLMDDFLASLPDDDSSLPLPPPSASFPASTLASPYSSSHAHTSHAHPPAHASQTRGFPQPLPTTVLGTSQTAPALQAGTSSLLDMYTRRGSHGQASTSNPQHASSGSTLGTTRPALHPHLSATPPAANAAHIAPARAADSSSKVLHKQQQEGFHLPVLVPPISTVTANNASDLSLPAIHMGAVGLSAQSSDNPRWPEVVTAAAAAAAQADSAAAADDEGSRGEQGLRGERSARVSRASSSVRSEQSVGSQSPDKAAAREQRHRVRRTLPNAHLALPVTLAGLADSISEQECAVYELKSMLCALAVLLPTSSCLANGLA